MISNHLRLYTWVDVEEVLIRALESHQWPDELIKCLTYKNELKLTVSPGGEAPVLLWLEGIFGAHFSQEKRAITLEPGSESRYCSVTLVEPYEGESENPPLRPFVPSLHRPKILTRNWAFEAPQIDFPSNAPSFTVFHSFKGGVGRTLHAVALAHELTKKGQKVLLIDGDFEAPGLSWLLEKEFPDPPICFADLLALIKVDKDIDCSTALEIATKRLSETRKNRLLLMPAFRSRGRWNNLEIKPEYIPSTDRPFILTQVLSQLGRRLGVNHIIVDLRAGLSELSAGLLLDPRLHRILVTSPSGQALRGTEEIIKLLAQVAPPKGSNPLPSAIISLVQSDFMPYPEINGEWNLERAMAALITEPTEETPDIILTEFNQSLLRLTFEWQDTVKKIESANLGEGLKPLIEKLFNQEKPIDPITDLMAARERFAQFAQSLEYAESGGTHEMLAIHPLKRLATNFAHRLPHTVVVGPKGSGKTYTFTAMLKEGNWSSFQKKIEGSDGEISAEIAAITAPRHLKEHNQDIVLEREGELQALLSSLDDTAFQAPMTVETLSEYINKALIELDHESDWRNFWLDAIAWRLGHKPGQLGVGITFPEFLQNLAQKKEEDLKIICLFDGLEDWFQKIEKNQNQQIALRALIMDTVEWLSQLQRLQHGSLGVVIFVRADLVNHAIRQNAGQFLKKYEPYQLKWSHDEALRLAAWMAAHDGFLDRTVYESEGDMESLKTALYKLWGYKLGDPQSREGRTAIWILAALSDFHLQLQPRDLIRLLAASAEKSKNDRSFTDRLLTPGAIKSSIEECSAKKLEEVEKENTPLHGVLSKIKDAAGPKTNPFKRGELGLEDDDIEQLKREGVILIEGDKIWMAEIYRPALGLESGKARNRIMSLMKRAGMR